MSHQKESNITTARRHSSSAIKGHLKEGKHALHHPNSFSAKEEIICRHKAVKSTSFRSISTSCTSFTCNKQILLWWGLERVWLAPHRVFMIFLLLLFILYFVEVFQVKVKIKWSGCKCSAKGRWTCRLLEKLGRRERRLEREEAKEEREALVKLRWICLKAWCFKRS